MRFVRLFLYMFKKLGNLSIRLYYPQLRNSFRSHSHLTHRERVKLYQLAKGKRKIAEIGAYVGASACCFGAATKGEFGQAEIFCIDTWNNDTMTEGVRNTWYEFIANTVPYSDIITPIRGVSVEVVDKICQHTDRLDLLFIDGDHSYEGVKRDWDAYKKFLAKGSVVAFHDIGWAEGVKRVVREDVYLFVNKSGQLPNLWWGILAQQP